MRAMNTVKFQKPTVAGEGREGAEGKTPGFPSPPSPATF